NHGDHGAQQYAQGQRLMWPLFLIPVFVAATVALLVVSAAPHKSPLSVKLEQIQARNISGPARERFAVMEKIFGDDGITQIQKQLMEAGWYTTTPAQVGARVAAGVVVGSGIGLLALLFIHPLSTPVLLLPLIPAMLGAYAPFLNLNQAIGKRKAEVQRSLPDFLDMVSTTVQAGISLNAALGYAVPVAAGALGDEIKECLSQIRLGRRKSDALRAVAARVNQPQLTATITAITQAERLGANISLVLNELAKDVRNSRIMAVEEQAAKLPIKMVFPMAIFLLPALFTIIFGSVAAELLPQYVSWAK
ncbi:MAG TPA: type II secretion system F family protein, partial [Verrucomicrobiae bacterium]|nr:type II secretion system F family protein [Verrucomicrobiae bacterium]